MKIQLEKTFEKYKDEFLKFDRVNPKHHPRPDMCAFIRLHLLSPLETADMIAAAEHDEIWLNVDCQKLAENATEEDIRDLVRCGIMYDDETESLHMFV